MSTTPLFSIIMPSRLSDYKGSAKDKVMKFKRAVNSALMQDFRDFELIIVADGCERTFQLLDEMTNLDLLGSNRDKMRAYSIQEQMLWSGTPRNVGILKAKGEYIVYLDTDDRYTPSYLEDMARGIMEHPDKDWFWFNDLRYNKITGVFQENFCSVDIKGRCGTSNVCHKRTLNAFWDVRGKYDHDWRFVQRLKASSKKFARLDCLGYEVCHLPNLYDV